MGLGPTETLSGMGGGAFGATEAGVGAGARMLEGGGASLICVSRAKS